MKLEFSPLVTSVSGRFGGLVFSSWQGVPLARIFRRPSQPRTAAQVAHRNAFRNLLRLYGQIPAVNWAAVSGLNDIWKQSWVNLAKRQPGQGRNFFLAAPLKQEKPSFYNQSWFGSSVVEAGPEITEGTHTATTLEFSVAGGGAPPPGYEVACFLVGLAKATVDITTPTLENGLFHGAAIGSGEKHQFTGLAANTQYQVHASVVYVATADPSNIGLLRLSAETISDYNTPAS